jgi:uroporphyrinogen decarboxylase
MNRRDRFYGAVYGHPIDRVPVSVWMHFVTVYLSGEEAAERHCQFFRQYNLDIAKAVSDYRFKLPEGMGQIQSADDFGCIRKVSMSHPSFSEQINLLTGIRKRLGENWPVIDTLFDPIQMVLRRAGFSALRLILDNPRKALPMIQAATETAIDYVRELKKIDVDGVFYSTRGAATKSWEHGYSDSEFCELLKPFDIAILDEMEGMVRILHTCKSHLDLLRVDDYPHEVLSWADKDPTCPNMRQVREVSKKCLMGGINHTQVIEQGVEEIRMDIDSAISINKNKKFILSPGCTIGSNVPDHVLRTISGYTESLKDVA